MQTVSIVRIYTFDRGALFHCHPPIFPQICRMSQSSRFPEIPMREFDYHLPEERIPAYPLEQRDQSKLLVYDGGEVTDHHFFDLPEMLRTDDLLVMNNTRVIKARLQFVKSTGSRIEVFCLEPTERQDPAIALSAKQQSTWNCLIKGSKKWKKDQILSARYPLPQGELIMHAERLGELADANQIKLSWQPADLSFAEVLSYAGAVPIPPYLQRDSEPNDEERYQTVYASMQGSVAAPTAGLHFTDKVLEQLGTKGIRTLEVTLHVGAGTFKPVKEDNAANHLMHEELFSVSRAVLEHLLQHRGRIIPVGTTSMRTLESLYWMAVRIKAGLDPTKIDQWDHLNQDHPKLERREVFELLLSQLNQRGETTLNSGTGIMIVPGYQFRLCDGLITNFHQPRSTLLLLIAALIGPDWRKVYNHALDGAYRFLSFGDSSLLIPKQKAGSN